MINGRRGRDRIWGGAGNDKIQADGQDIVAGGGGADRIRLTANAARSGSTAAPVATGSRSRGARCEPQTARAPHQQVREGLHGRRAGASHGHAGRGGPGRPARHAAAVGPAGLPHDGHDTRPISVAWNASTDNVGVTGYRIYRNGTHIAHHGGDQLHADRPGLRHGSTQIGLTAIDAAGNESYRPEAIKNESTTACGDASRRRSRRASRTTGTTQTSISVRWNASTDNVGVTGYRIYRNGTRIAHHDGDHLHADRPGLRYHSTRSA